MKTNSKFATLPPEAKGFIGQGDFHRDAAMRWPQNRIILALLTALAACGGGSGDKNSPSTSAPATAQTVPAPCLTAPTLFTQTVWPTLTPTCTGCHISGGIAGGTGLVFSNADTLANYNILRDYAANKSALLLSKSIGQPTHGGGSPFVNAQSTQYKNLQSLIPLMQAQVCVASPSSAAPLTADAVLLKGVTLTDNNQLLSRAAVLFAGRNPSPTEANAVVQGGDLALRQTIRSYMQGDAFNAFLGEVGDTHFLTPGVSPRDGNTGLKHDDWPTAAPLLGVENVAQAEGSIKSRFDASIRREPIELMKYIINNDLPYTEIVSAPYTVVNGLMAQYLGARVEGSFVNPTNDNEFRKATLPDHRLGGTREHAGVLSTHAWLQRFPTTATNRNRHRVNMLSQQFLATNLSALATRPLDDTTSFKIPTVQNPNCVSCHSVMDPMAAGFQNWNEANRYRPHRTTGATLVDHALPNSYLSRSYPKALGNQPYYQAGDNWFRDGASPGYAGAPMPEGFKVNPTALQWLGRNVAADPRLPWGPCTFGTKVFLAAHL